MSTRFRRQNNEYQPLPRTSLDLDGPLAIHRRSSLSPQRRSLLARLSAKLPGRSQLAHSYRYAHYVAPRRRKRSVLRLVYWTFCSTPYIILFAVLFVSLFLPAYTHRPPHYDELRGRALASKTPGRANAMDEKIFIAASIYEEEGELSGGAWGKAVLDLVDLLGPGNVHLSVYENDADMLTKGTLGMLEKNAPCNTTILSEDLDLASLPRTELPTGETRLKRIAFLANVRNRALAPLAKSLVRFDRILYINDVNFDPIEAAQLLFSTNIDMTGRADYDAACAVDFINPFKFYDRFATRDLDGYDTGIPFYPWFTNAGSATSRKDVLAGTDAVRVRSCWGGMTAYAAEFFQDQSRFSSPGSEPAQFHSPPSNSSIPSVPLSFRFDTETFWESSECCLINADLQYLRMGQTMPPSSRIYMNPFVRVAYTPTVLSWLGLSRRPERLYAPIHNILNKIVGFPLHNPRREEEPGDTVVDQEWTYDDWDRGLRSDATDADRKGKWVKIQRRIDPGGWCAGRQLLVINEHPGDEEGRWGKIDAPRPPA